MATERRMIEPFAENQARARGVNLLRRVVLTATDMRVAPEFKIFTNALSAVVDPKQFDSQVVRRVRRAMCESWPPNSFALAPGSIEYFRIPRNVLNDLRRQEHLPPRLRDHHQRDARSSPSGRGFVHARDLE